MIQESNQKISVSLSPELLRYAESFQQSHKLSSRSEVISLAIQALREKELYEGYKAMAADYQNQEDPLVESGINDGLEPSDESSW